jgi:heme/copper-type cytochrome/quinol oxidase subunit 4
MTQLASAGLNITSWELIIVLFLIGVGFLLGLLLGKDKLFLMLLGSYISSALLHIVPLRKMFSGFFAREENFVVLIVLFLFLIGIVYFLFSRSMSKGKRKIGRSLFYSFFYGLFLVGIVLSTIFIFLPQDLVDEFSSLTLKIFNTSLARTLWFVIPLIFIGIFRSKR